MFIVVESGKRCGQSFLGFLWASSENELAATTAMLQAVGLCGRGEETSPVSIFIARTFGLHRTERSEPGKVRQNPPAETHSLAACDSNLSRPGAARRPGFLAHQTGGAEGAQATRQPPEQNEKPLPSWLSDSLFSRGPGGGRKRGRNLKQYQGHLFQDLKMLVAHISI